MELKLNRKQYKAFEILHDNTTNELLFGGGAGGGKAQPLYSKILTVEGFKPMRDISIGDFLISPQNKKIKVIDINPGQFRDIYEIEFIDGAKTKASDNHLWSSWIARRKGRTKKERTTIEIIEELNKGKNVIIPMSDKLDFGNDFKEIDPYLIGVMMGDGNFSSFSITSDDNEIIKEIESKLPKGYNIKKIKHQHYAIQGHIINKKGYRESKLKNTFKKHQLNNVGKDKFINNRILQSSLNTRLEIIKGLMDTDGTIDSRGHCSFSNKSLKLCKNLQYLIRSIGGKATLTKKKKFCIYNGVKKYGTYYELYINTNNNKDLFRLKRKLKRVKRYNGGFELGRRIKKIKYIGKEECKCITVEGGLYITDDFIVTHNSYLGCVWILSQAMKFSDSRWVIGRSKLKSLKETTLATFFEVCKIFEFKSNLNYKYNAQDSTVILDNGSKIILKDLYEYPADPNFDSLGSLEITGAFVDECNQITYKSWEVLKSRIRFKLDEFGLIPKILGTCNPAKNWVYSEFYKPKEEKKLDNNKEFIQSLVGDNPFISNYYIENLRNIKNKATKERLLKGNWDYDDDPSCLFDFDTINDLFTNKGKEGEKYLTIDVARKGQDRTIIREWNGLQSIKSYNLDDDIKRDLTKTRDWIKNLCERKQIRISNVLVDEDGIGGGLVDMLGCKGFLNGSAPLEENNIKPNYQNLKTQCWFKLAEMAKDGIIGIDAEQEERDKLVEELGQIKQKNIDKDGKLQVLGKDEIKESLGRSTDGSDTLMMRMWFELKSTPNIWII